METSIQWDKIGQKPEKSYKIPGQVLLNLKKKIALLSRSNDELEKRLSKEINGKGELMAELSVAREKVSINEAKILEKEEIIKSHAREISSLKDERDSLRMESAALKDDYLSKIRLRDEEIRILEFKMEKAKQLMDELEQKVFHEQSLNSLNVARYIFMLALFQKKLAMMARENMFLIDKVVELETEREIKVTPVQDHQVMNVRACMTCKQYVLIKDDDYLYQRANELFKGYHRGHMLGTLNYNEVKKGFSSRTQEFLEKALKA
ncbi:MAG: hypothetical protein ACTSYS_15650 [Promethearchaeota archaeon]